MLILYWCSPSPFLYRTDLFPFDRFDIYRPLVIHWHVLLQVTKFMSLWYYRVGNMLRELSLTKVPFLLHILLDICSLLNSHKILDAQLSQFYAVLLLFWGCALHQHCDKNRSKSAYLHSATRWHYPQCQMIRHYLCQERLQSCVAQLHFPPL